MKVTKKEIQVAMEWNLKVGTEIFLFYPGWLDLPSGVYNVTGINEASQEINYDPMEWNIEEPRPDEVIIHLQSVQFLNPNFQDLHDEYKDFYIPGSILEEQLTN